MEADVARFLCDAQQVRGTLYRRADDWDGEEDEEPGGVSGSGSGKASAAAAAGSAGTSAAAAASGSGAGTSRGAAGVDNSGGGAAGWQLLHSEEVGVEANSGTYAFRGLKKLVTAEGAYR